MQAGAEKSITIGIIYLNGSGASEGREMSGEKQYKTHALMVLVALIWGLSWPVGRMLAHGLPPMTGAWMRYVLTMIIFYAWFTFQAASGKPVQWFTRDKKSLKTVTILALTGVLGYQLFFMHGVYYTAASDASLIITFNPIFTVLLAAPLLGQKISAKMLVGLTCGFIGVAIVTGWSPNTQIEFADRILGDILIMFAALSWATTTNMTRRMMEQRGGEGPSTALQIVVWYSLIGTVLLTPLAIYETWQFGLPDPTTHDWYAIFYLGALSTVLAYYWFVKGIEKLGATSAASYVFVVPVFGVLGSWWLLDEKIGISLVIGFILIVAGVKVVRAESERLRTT